MNKIKIVVGDWSGDGHSMTSEYTYDCSINKEELQKAFKEGSEIIGFNLSDICEDYEDNKISEDCVEKVFNHLPDFNFEDFTKEEYDNECDLTLTPDDFVKLYFEIARLGKNFIYNKVESESINIGGYGLFW